METSAQKSTRLAVLQKSLELMMQALGLVAALAWNDAIQSMLRDVFGVANGIVLKFLYAFVITALLVWIGYRISQLEKILEERSVKSR